VLGNQLVQVVTHPSADVVASTSEYSELFTILERRFLDTTPESRLAALKEHFSRAQNRDERIIKARQALNAQSGLKLTRDQWIMAAESPEFEEEF